MKNIFVIAEVGSNWRTLVDCLNSITLAKNCGADAVKFQLFSHRELYGYDGEMPFSLPREWIPKLVEKAKSCGIEFMCTAFSLDGYMFLNQYVKKHKVASSNMLHIPILQYLKTVGKPVILSTGGGWSLKDVSLALATLADSPPVFLLHCVAAYPANRTKLDRIFVLQEKFPKCIIGYSDHSTNYTDIPIYAKSLGAELIEKHVNFVNCKETPDSPHSLSTEQFQVMVRLLKEGGLDIENDAEEDDMKLRHLVRLMATEDIASGSKLVYGHNYGIFRSKKDAPEAMHAMQWDKVDGQVVNMNVAKGTPIFAALLDV